jgi:ATP-dependent RNA helicase DDX51/DBP6
MTVDTSGLPKWLAHPVIISTSTTAPLSSPDDELIFESLGIEGLFPFQSYVRDRLRLKHPEGPRDLCVSAPTGSGKTLAYVLPVVEKLKERIVGRLRALVVVPTRDLVPQVEETFRMVCEAYKCGNLLKNGVDYMVTTPGKLISGLPLMKLDSLKYLVVDEADRLLDQSFQEWLPQLLNTLKNDKTVQMKEFDSDAWNEDAGHVQKLLFSATLTTNPAKISPLNLYRPLYLTVRSNNGEDSIDKDIELVTPETLKETMVVFNGAEELKPAVLVEVFEEILPKMIGDGEKGKILCFTKSVSSTQRLTKLLSVMRPELRVCAFHGTLSDIDRSRLLEEFATGKVQVLVGSDAMARGLDLKSVRCVVNYDMPMFAATYVHRVGRTARAGQIGWATTILPASQTRNFKKMIKGNLGKNVVEFEFNLELKWNEVGKIEIEEEIINEKWRQVLSDSLQDLKNNNNSKMRLQ